MFLSIYTFVKNGLFLDYHVVEMLKHHLPLADEIIVNEGYSSDGTFEAISQISAKIKIFRSEWGQPRNLEWFTEFKDQARRKCTGDWCILLDCDEFIPEWEFERLREFLERTDEIMIPLRIVNFYGNYKVFNLRPERMSWPARKTIIHRNLPQIEVWGDGANVRQKNTPLTWESSSQEFSCHHFGFVRNPARLRQKWNTFGRIYKTNKRKWSSWIRLPALAFDLRPHDWMDPELLPDLAIYDGLEVRAVLENPAEFVRDGFAVYNYLASRHIGAAPGRPPTN